MKTTKLQTTLAACTGRTMLYCYRLYISVFKETDAYKPFETKPAKGYSRLTSTRFQKPCYN